MSSPGPGPGSCGSGAPTYRGLGSRLTQERGASVEADGDARRPPGRGDRRRGDRRDRPRERDRSARTGAGPLQPRGAIPRGDRRGGARVRLIRSEALKLWSVRTTWVMLGIGLLVEGLFAGLYVGLVNLKDVGSVREVQSSTGLLMVMMLVLGVLAITTEFRHGTASSTFLATPRRYPVMAAKLAAVLGLGLLAGLVYVVDQRRPRPAALLIAGRNAPLDRGHRLGLRRLRGLARPALRLRPRGRRDRPQPGRGDHRGARLLLHPLAAARTAAGLDRPLLPGAGDRVAARRPRRTRATASARSPAASCSPPGPAGSA